MIRKSSSTELAKAFPTSTIHVLILVLGFFAIMKEWALKKGALLLIRSTEARSQTI
jgi:hypothetical protein